MFDGQEIAYSRTVVQVPDQQTWNMEKVSGVNIRPFQLHTPKEPRVIFRDTSGEADAENGDLRVCRRLYIKKADLEAFGYTEGCVKCDHDLLYGYGRTTKGHSDQCRQRIMKALATTPAGMERIQAAAGRAKVFLEHLADQDKEVPAQGGMRGLRKALDVCLPAFEPLQPSELTDNVPIGQEPQHDARGAPDEGTRVEPAPIEVPEEVQM